MAEPGGLPSMGSHRVGHDWSDLAAAAAAAARSSLLCGLSVVSVLGLLIWWLLSKRGTGTGCTFSVFAACGFGRACAKASVVGAQGLSCSEACRIFPDQGSNLWPLHWQVDSYPLYHQVLRFDRIERTNPSQCSSQQMTSLLIQCSGHSNGSHPVCSILPYFPHPTC